MCFREWGVELGDNRGRFHWQLICINVNFVDAIFAALRNLLFNWVMEL